jgi:hypothetical protein
MPALLMSLLPHCQNHYLLAHQEHETLKETHHCNRQSFVVMAAVDGGGSKISLSYLLVMMAVHGAKLSL